MTTAQDKKAASDIEQLLQQWAKENSKGRVDIITAGKSGAGKSTLLNNFLDLQGDEAFEAHMCPISVTTEVEHHDKVIHGVSVRVIDTPGLHAHDHTSGHEDKVTKDLAKFVDEQGDILLFCVQLTDKLNSVVWQNIDTLNRAFGEKIWKRTILVFTWADVVLGNGQDLQAVISQYCENMQRELDKRKINVKVKSVYAFENDEDRFKFDGIVGLPATNKANIPELESWKMHLLLQCTRQCRKGNIGSLFALNRNLWNDYIRPSSKSAIYGATTGACVGAVLSALAAVPTGPGVAPSASAGAHFGAQVGGFIGLTAPQVLKAIMYAVSILAEQDEGNEMDGPLAKRRKLHY